MSGGDFCGGTWSRPETPGAIADVGVSLTPNHHSADYSAVGPTAECNHRLATAGGSDEISCFDSRGRRLRFERRDAL
jgi:hypothetical protein